MNQDNTSAAIPDIDGTVLDRGKEIRVSSSMRAAYLIKVAMLKSILKGEPIIPAKKRVNKENLRENLREGG